MLYVHREKHRKYENEKREAKKLCRIVFLRPLPASLQNWHQIFFGKDFTDEKYNKRTGLILLLLRLNGGKKSVLLWGTHVFALLIEQSSELSPVSSQQGKYIAWIEWAGAKGVKSARSLYQLQYSISKDTSASFQFFPNLSSNANNFFCTTPKNKHNKLQHKSIHLTFNSLIYARFLMKVTKIPQSKNCNLLQSFKKTSRRCLFTNKGLTQWLKEFYIMINNYKSDWIRF